jgi:hypothetical protein
MECNFSRATYHTPGSIHQSQDKSNDEVDLHKLLTDITLGNFVNITSHSSSFIHSIQAIKYTNEAKEGENEGNMST